MTAASKPCPCGRGTIRVDITYRDTDWGMSDQSWEGFIDCDQCAPRFAFVSAGRGVDIVPIEQKSRASSLHAKANDLLNAAMGAPSVGAVIEALAAELDTLPTVAARYRLLVSLHVETATLSTFRRHVRGVPMRNWLDWQFPKGGAASQTLKRLLPIFEYFAIPSGFISEAIAEAAVLGDQALYELRPVMSLGPISLFAALAGSSLRGEVES